MLCSDLKERAMHSSVLMRRNCSDVTDCQGILRYMHLYSARQRKKCCGSLESLCPQTPNVKHVCVFLSCMFERLAIFSCVWTCVSCIPQASQNI